MKISETIKDAIHNHTQGMSEEDVKFFENQTKDKILSAFKEMVEEWAKNSRTIEEKYGIGVKEEMGRQQLRADLLSSLTEE